jgi:hypothetical protein
MNNDESGVEKRVAAFLGPEDQVVLRNMGRALINVLEAIAPNPETDTKHRALQIAAATLLQAAVYRRFGVSGLQVARTDADSIPDSPPPDMRP